MKYLVTVVLEVVAPSARDAELIASRCIKDGTAPLWDVIGIYTAPDAELKEDDQ